MRTTKVNGEMSGDVSRSAGWGILRVSASAPNDRTLIVRLDGELDIYSAGDLHNQLRQLECGRTEVVIDLSGLAFIDCAGLRELVEADARARARGGRLTLIDGPPAVRRLFTLTGLKSTFEFRSFAGEPG